MTSAHPMTLRRSVVLFCLSCLAAVTVVCAAFVYLRGDRFTDSTLAFASRFRTTAAAGELARMLERDWHNLIFLTEQASKLTPDQLSYLMTGAGGNPTRISWVGYADLSGVVVSATNDLLVGQDVSERPWYRNGLTGGFAGDVHDAVLLAQLLGGDSDEPLRFIDLARPVQDESGDISGVIGMHINANWLADYLRETSERFGIDLYLINPAGTISASSTDQPPTEADLQILRTAQTGISAEGRETWPDGRDYFSTIVPEVTSGDLPSFGWRMIGRLDANSVSFGVDLIRNGAHYAALVALALVFLITIIYSRLILAPLSRLAKSAEQIAEGSQDYPANSRVTLEASQLSAALMRLQKDPATGEH